MSGTRFALFVSIGMTGIGLVGIGGLPWVTKWIVNQEVRALCGRAPLASARAR
jgi:hypothetical protein